MRAYLLTTGLIFAFIVVAHVARMVAESASFARDPFYVGLTLLCAALATWAAVLLRRRPVRSSPP